MHTCTAKKSNRLIEERYNIDIPGNHLCQPIIHWLLLHYIITSLPHSIDSFVVYHYPDAAYNQECESHSLKTLVIRNVNRSFKG